MSVFTRGRALAALTPAAALAVSLFAAPAAQASAVRPLTVRPATIWVNCAAATVGEDGGQWYVEDACSPVNATSWALAVECSNAVWYESAFFTSFEDETLYCPVGTTPVNAEILYTT